MVPCTVLLSGETRPFPGEAVRFRPAAYGLYVRDDRILLGRSKFTARWDIPGGGVEAWETLEEGLTREFWEETGVRVAAIRLIEFREGFIAFIQHPFHSLRYYYSVSGTEPANETLCPDREEVSSVHWVGLSDIDPGECAPGDYALIARVLTREGERPNGTDGPRDFTLG